jgi:hypothetical protein
LLERGYNDARNEFDEYSRNPLVKTVEKK